MSAIWMFIEKCLSDTRRAEDLLASGSGRRALRLHTETALEDFVLVRPITATRRPAAARPRGGYTALVAPAER